MIVVPVDLAHIIVCLCCFPTLVTLIFSCDASSQVVSCVCCVFVAVVYSVQSWFCLVASCHPPPLCGGPRAALAAKMRLEEERQ